MEGIFNDWNTNPNGAGIESGLRGMDTTSFAISQISLDNIQDDPDAVFAIKKLSIPLSRKTAKGNISDPYIIHTMAEAHGVFAIATEGKGFIRYVVNDIPEDIELPFKDDKVNRVFIDPTGNHIVISTVSGDLYYLHSSKTKFTQIKRLSGNTVECIAWNPVEGNAMSTGPILMGTRNGKILETCLEVNVKAMKEVFSMAQNMPICSLHIDCIPSHLASSSRKYLVMASTANPSRYFKFIGGPDFETLFRNCRSMGNQDCTELPGDLNHTELRFFTKPGEQCSSSFALLTGYGTYYEKLGFNEQMVGSQLAKEKKEIVHTVPPMSIAVTEYHILFLYKRKLQVSSLLSDEIVYERETSSEIKGLCPDLNGNIFIYTDREVFEVCPHNEDRDVWKLFLHRAKEGDAHDFEKALELCKEPVAREEVRRAQADFHFTRGNYIEAAEYYADTQLSLEEIALQFMEVHERGALRQYLLRKMEDLPLKKRAQRTLLGTWLTEIYLDEINGMRVGENMRKNGTTRWNAATVFMSPITLVLTHFQSSTDEEEDIKQEMIREFRGFLTTNKASLDVPTTYSLLSSHGCIEELLFFAQCIEDYDRVLTHHIQREDIASAIYILKEAPVEKAEGLYYKFSPQMLLASPHETVDAWIEQKFLSPCKLIPALVRYNQQHKTEDGENEAIRYLEFVVTENQNTDPAIHNYLLSLYAMQEDSTALMNFLHLFKDNYIYDVKYALRVCIQEGKHEACVFIYTLLHLYEEAVKLALKIDINLAKETVEEVDEENTELKRKLWLLIACYLIEDQEDINAATALLEECDLLKIDDLLPWFPDFVVIDKYKDRIISSLRDYNDQIDDLKQEMEKFTLSAEQIRKEIRGLKTRHGDLRGDQMCELCDQAILSRVFYLFPCSHAFHADCLLTEMLKHLSAGEKAKVKELQDKLRPLNHGVISQNDQEIRDKLQAELDAIIAAECPLCGNVMIKSITQSFISKEEEAEAELWSI